MIDRTQLTEALELADGDWPHPVQFGQDSVVVEAARILLDFPTDQQVRVAMQAQRVVDDRIVNGESSEGEFEAMEAALEAVRDTMIGDQ